MRLKIDVTPFWWKIEAKNPETFAEWCVKAVRAILSVWSRAEVRLSREKLFAVVTFDGAERVGQAQADKSKIRMMLAEIVGMDDTQPKVPEKEALRLKDGWWMVGGSVVQWQRRAIDEGMVVAVVGVEGDVEIEPEEPPFCRIRGITDKGIGWISRVDKS